MRDPLRSKLNLIITAVVAFAIGLGIAARFDLTPPGVAQEKNPPLRLVSSNWDASAAQTIPMNGFAEIAEQITPAVVTIYVDRDIAEHSRRRLPEPFDQFQPEIPPTVRGSGSGFIISEDGYIVTNNHVVEDAARITVELFDRRRFDDVRLVGRDATTDIALLKLEADDLTAASLGTSEGARVGEWVLAVGSPGFTRGTEPLTMTVTAGIISAKGRNIRIIDESSAIEDFIQTDAAINPGNSGGPLINAQGRVIGVNAAIASRSGSYEGYGFAVPIDLAREVIDDLVEYGRVRRALLGVQITAVDAPIATDYGLERPFGAQVLRIEEGMAAAEAGIRVGDLIVAIDGEQVESVNDLQTKIRKREPGETVRVEVVDYERERRTVSVRLEEAEAVQTASIAPEVAEETPDPLGLVVDEISSDVRRALDIPGEVDGVMITEMDRFGQFAQRWGRMSPSDNPIIVSVNRTEVGSVDDYRREIARVEPGDVVSLLVYDPNQRGTIPVSVPLPSNPR
ncbi:MAG: trypsin-like peptidase domain-containing protein [marine benthic group bacterium]|jgi:serine protease Do|nr:trypsin-like peptidase domain-containing protein [Gemmatimonadota bacterium]MCL7962415.1 trypsin-like peptidase domain-containing protein [Candidatus Carthagonibacter metallireducens]MCL7964742.1 trypsin-like peptidase domain-containing protein [Gemmatimonadota bacterium]MCL7969024.1 trypsin-like peptidase domain-containing protein [Gemmatimonadota bacterium]MCL7976226.1 trypsin-like peptidase domain-containing protein [Gemmatimonadota bacterium]